jgi:hypothetical protein
MEREVKHSIIKMLIPVIGTWWVLKRLLNFGDITWWDYSIYSPPLTIGLVFYQVLCWIGYKVFYMMYFFNYTFEQVFTKW